MGGAHFGVGLAAKRFAPGVPLGVLLLAADALDALWAVFQLAGIEHADVKQERVSVPWSHGLIMSAIWSAIAGVVGARFYRSYRNGAVIGLLVFSHWVLDFISHPMARVSLKPFTVMPAGPPDLPVLFGGSPKVGLGLGKSFRRELAVELGLITLGVVTYIRTRSAIALAAGRKASQGWFRSRQGGTQTGLSEDIKAINLGGVNCYLVKAGDGFVLIDTGVSEKRTQLERALEDAGCRPGDLKLIVLTHGDHDHAGNGAYLREKCGAEVAMHNGDSGMVERGDMNWNRKPKPDRFSPVFRIASFLLRVFGGPRRFDTFRPDMYIEDGYDLNGYGFEARVLHIPGHSKGSLGILTSTGDLFCGDLLYNVGRPGSPFVDDLADFNASIERLKGLGIHTVYPGHGKPFPMERYMKRFR